MFSAEEFVDLGLAVEVYVDAVGGVENLGANFQTTFIRWMKNGSAFVPVPVLRLIRPRGSLLSQHGGIEKMLRTMAPPSARDRRLNG